jgi:nucleoside diphosphate kinase
VRFLIILFQVDHTKSDGAERTLVLLKPDAVVRGHIGVTIAHFENCGLNVENLRVFDKVPQATLAEHYKEHAGKGFYDELLQYMASGPVVAIQVLDRLRSTRLPTCFHSLKFAASWF